MDATPARLTRVFVYGTLRRGGRNHALLAGSRCLGAFATQARYRLLDLGPYPALVDGGSDRVAGEVYEVEAVVLERLDELEGHPTFYRRAPIALDPSAPADVQGYLLAAEQTSSHPRVEPGRDGLVDWCTVERD